MEIKPYDQGERVEIDIREWNDEAKAWLKPLSSIERLVFNDWLVEMYDKTNDANARFDAAFNAALMALVDENGAPLLAETDRDAIKRADFQPIFRMFSAAMTRDAQRAEEFETAKKN